MGKIYFAKVEGLNVLVQPTKDKRALEQWIDEWKQENKNYNRKIEIVYEEMKIYK